MNKQIIIDEMIEEIGLDVQQCKYLEIIEDAPNYPEIGGTYTAFECNLYCRDCRFIDGCRYKQLLRKEQECERLKDELINIKWKIEAQDIELNNKEEQLDQLKAENEQLKNNDVFSIRYFKDKYDKYKQALQEIKEVAKELLQTKIPFCTIHEKIMEIINEVEDGF